MEPNVNLKGQIADASQLGLPQQNSPYVCVNLRGRWQWQPIKNISAKTFKDVRDSMYKNIHNCLQLKIRDEKRYNINISGCSASTRDYINGAHINGKWRPLIASSVREGEFNAYGSSTGTKFLYCVKRQIDGVEKYEWWLGVEEKMNNREAHGFLRQKTATTQSIAPWQVNRWLVWNKPGEQAGRWLEQQITVEKIDNEWEINKAIEIKTQELAEQTQETIDMCNATLNTMNKSRSQHMEVSHELFNRLTKEERFALVDTSKFRKVFKKQDLCSCCFSAAPTTKCIHQDCTGACAKCRSDNEDDDCCACGKKQVMECPICQCDNFPVSFMKIFRCGHGVCYKCFSTAFEVKRELKNCPMCRAAI